MDDAVAFLVRHGMHDWLRPGRNRLAGRLPGIPLNAEGRREAKHVAVTLADVPLAYVVASPLERTVETAEIIARRHDLPVERDDRFIEAGLGQWEGEWVADIVARAPAEWEAWRTDPSRVRVPGMESLESIADRMETGCREWLARGGQGVIVSHQDPLAALLCRFVGSPLRSIRAWDVRTGSLSIVRQSPHGVVVEAVNAGIPLIR